MDKLAIWLGTVTLLKRRSHILLQSMQMETTLDFRNQCKDVLGVLQQLTKRKILKELVVDFVALLLWCHWKESLIMDCNT